MADKDITVYELLEYLKENMATKAETASKEDLEGLRQELKGDMVNLRQEIRSDVDTLLDQHLQTYMVRYDELAKRVKQLEEFVGYAPKS